MLYKRKDDANPLVDQTIGTTGTSSRLDGVGRLVGTTGTSSRLDGVGRLVLQVLLVDQMVQIGWQEGNTGT